MASNPDFVSYICEQLEGLGAVRSRKMFGEYMVYLNDKPVIIICDDRPMVKMLPCLEELLRGRPTEPPYEGAKDHYLLDPDDRDTLREAARLAEEVTPLPKKKAPKKKESAKAEGPVPWDVVWPQQMKPGLSDIGAWVNNPLLEELMAWMGETYGVEPSVEFSRCSMDRGWNIKYKKGSKALCVLYVRSGWFTAMVTLGAVRGDAPVQRGQMAGDRREEGQAAGGGPTADLDEGQAGEKTGLTLKNSFIML